MMPRLNHLPSTSTAKEAVELIESFSKALSIEQSSPSLRTLRLWRTKGWLSKGSHRFTRRNLLEALGIMSLCADGIATGAAAQKVAKLDDNALEALVLAQTNMATTKSRDFAEVTLTLLAQGVVRQHHRIRRGSIVGLVRPEQNPNESTPLALRQAMARLGRLYFEDGQEDRAASVHQLLVHCMEPLAHWAPSILCSLPETSDLVLIDPDYRVPSEDCEAIVEQAQGSRLEDLIERRLHSQLMHTLERLGSDADAAYTTIREFIARHPLATTEELQTLRTNPELPNDAVVFVHSFIYSSIHADYAVKGFIRRCYHCQAPIDREGRCFLHGCREDHPQVCQSQPVPQMEAHVAQTEVLKYWVDPAREELRLFDSLRREGIQAVLYPRQDQCDVAVGDAVGVDIKDYRGPATLARRLNRGIAGLRDWDRKIIAIADRRIRSNTDYITHLKEQLNPRVRNDVEILSVSATIKELCQLNQHTASNHETET